MKKIKWDLNETTVPDFLCSFSYFNPYRYEKVKILSLNDGRVPDLERPLVALVDPVVSLLLQRVRHRLSVKIIILGCKVQR